MELIHFAAPAAPLRDSAKRSYQIPLAPPLLPRISPSSPIEVCIRTCRILVARCVTRISRAIQPIMTLPCPPAHDLGTVRCSPSCYCLLPSNALISRSRPFASLLLAMKSRREGLETYVESQAFRDPTRSTLTNLSALTCETRVYTQLLGWLSRCISNFLTKCDLIFLASQN